MNWTDVSNGNTTWSDSSLISSQYAYHGEDGYVDDGYVNPNYIQAIDPWDDLLETTSTWLSL